MMRTLSRPASLVVHATWLALVALLLPAGLTAGAGQAAATGAAQAPGRLVVLVNRSMVLSTSAAIEKFAVTDPAIADGLVVSPRELLIHGKKPGTISLIVWTGGRMTHYELVVDPGVAALQQRLQALFPGEDIQVTQSEKALVLSGRVSSPAIVDRAGEIAQKSVPENSVINLLQPPGGAPGVPTLQQRLRALFPGEDIQVSVSEQALILSGKVSSSAVADRAGEIAQKSEPEHSVINMLQPPGGSPGVPALQQRLQALFPGEDIQVSLSGKALILSGRVSSPTVVDRAGEIAGKTIGENSVINLLQAPAGAGSQQVMLQVRFAEVSHTALNALGTTLFGTGTNIDARSTTQSDAKRQSDTSGNPVLSFSDLLNLFVFQKDQGIGVVIRALQQTGSFESLAEPNLIAYNGKEASFLAGGEYPVVTSSIGGTSVSYKQFGVGLKFKPQIVGDLIHLWVRPEVSEPDIANGVEVAGFRIPAIKTRWAETEVELRDGQSFAIAGLLQSAGAEGKAAIPGLSKIPILGRLFQSKSKNEDRTELLVLITPHLVKPLNPDEVPPLPKIIKK
jgi:pilus assembly protein CpaC